MEGILSMGKIVKSQTATNKAPQEKINLCATPIA